MLQRYKLRLSDGTLLVVDHDALSSWLVDSRAMVQQVGSERWCSLKLFLLEERRAGSSWWSSKPAAEIPGVHRTLLDEEGALPPVRSPREPPLIQPPSPPVPLDEVVAPSPESMSGSSTLDVEPPATAVPLPSEPETAREVDVSLASAQLEPLPSLTEPPSIWVSTEELTATGSFSRPEAPAEEVPITLPEPLEEEGTPPSTAAQGSASEPLEPPPSPVLNLHALAEEAAAPPAGSTGRPAWGNKSVPIISREPLGDEKEAPRRRALRSRREPREAPLFPVPQVQVLAEDTVAPSVRSTPPESMSGVEAPVIAPRPLDDQLPFHAAALLRTDEDQWAERTPRLEAGFLGLAPPWGPRVNRWLGHLSRLLDYLGRWLDDFASRNRLSSRWARVLASGQGLAKRAVATRAGSLRPPSDGELSIIPLKLLDDEGDTYSHTVARPQFSLAAAIGKAVSMVTVLLDGLRRVAPGWSDRLRRWAQRPNRREPLWPHPSRDDGAMSGPFDEALRTPLMPPPALSELPVLRLAKIDEKEMEPLEDDIYEGPGFFDVAWLWAKRVTLLAGLVAGGIVAANTWEIWLPKAALLSRMMFVEIDERVHPTVPNRAEEPAEQIHAALQAANEQMPHLAPETIELVMSSSLAGVLDVPEVFGRAYDATERGMAALTAEEAQELKALRVGMLAGLHPAERERLREYELVRGRRVTLPFEDREALGLVARGARALPPLVRERFQWLAGKAIAAGLSLPDDSVPQAATAP